MFSTAVTPSPITPAAGSGLRSSFRFESLFVRADLAWSHQAAAPNSAWRYSTVLCLEPGDSIEIDFQTPSKLRVAGIVRNRKGYRFGLEFVTPLPS